MRARKIKPDEYNELIRWNEWDVGRVFHFLSGTPKYHSTLLKKTSLNKLELTINILNKEKCNVSGYEVGEFYKENSKRFFACKDGNIYVNLTLLFASFLLDLPLYLLSLLFVMQN